MNKKVKMKLVGLDGNISSIMGAFGKEARRQGWSKKKIWEVLDDAMMGDYNHFLATIATNVDEPEDSEDDEWQNDEDDDDEWENWVDA